MNPLTAWAEQVCAELGLTGADLPELTRQVLDLARDVAHGVDRPAAPLTAYLVGLAVGRASSGRPADVGAATAEVIKRVNALVEGWRPPTE